MWQQVYCVATEGLRQHQYGKATHAINFCVSLHLNFTCRCSIAMLLLPCVLLSFIMRQFSWANRSLFIYEYFSLSCFSCKILSMILDKNDLFNMVATYYTSNQFSVDQSVLGSPHAYYCKISFILMYDIPSFRVKKHCLLKRYLVIIIYAWILWV